MRSRFIQITCDFKLVRLPNGISLSFLSSRAQHIQKWRIPFGLPAECRSDEIICDVIHVPAIFPIGRYVHSDVISAWHPFWEFDWLLKSCSRETNNTQRLSVSRATTPCITHILPLSSGNVDDTEADRLVRIVGILLGQGFRIRQKDWIIGSPSQMKTRKLVGVLLS